MNSKSIFLITLVVLAGCTSTTPPPQNKKVVIKLGEPPSASQNKKNKTPPGVKITPYEQKEIKRQNVQVIVPEQKVQQKFNDGSQLPAFRTLMQKTQTAYKKQQLSEAERYAQQAQRIAPQATETYLYLALIADQRKQYANAEALARRGLSYAQSNAMKKQLWLVILKAAQQQKDQKMIKKKKKALKSL